MILKPAWKLLNQTLPIFTEVIGYGGKNTDSESEEESTGEDSWEEDDFDPN